MENRIFRGAGTALVTPFNKNGVDYEKFGELIEFQITNDINALIICGTTGEATTMPDDEHIEVIAYSVKKANGRVPIVAGTGSNDTRHAIILSQRAEEEGADAVLSVSPYYNKTNQQGLFHHFKSIAKSINIPVILYNVPTRTGINIEPETVYELSKIDNIVAVKECKFDQVGKIRNLCNQDFAIYTGNDNEILPLLSLGGDGVISVMGNIIPNDTSKIVANYFNGNTKKSTEMQLKALGLVSGIFCDVNPIPIKEAMNILGMNVGECRLPLFKMADEKIAYLEAELVKYGLL